MTTFRDQVFNWKGADYPVPADRVLEAIDVVESVVTLSSLIEMRRSGPKNGVLSRAFSEVLNFASAINPKAKLATVTAAEVYEGMFGSEETRESTTAALTLLVMMMIPPSALEKSSKSEAAPANPGNAPAKARAGSSKKPSK